MKLVRRCVTALAAAALGVGLSLTLSGPAHADSSWGTLIGDSSSAAPVLAPVLAP